MEILGLIPARGGSRGIERKNLALLAGRPLLAYTADAALGAKALTRLVLSTDDEEIAEAGRSLGLDVPFLRPAELSADDAPALPVILHALEHVPAEVVVLLQPTSPLRRAEHVDGAVELLLETGAETVVSVVRVPHAFSPASVLERAADGTLTAAGQDAPLRRQEKPELFARNGPAVLVLRTASLQKRGTLYGDATIGYEMSPLDSVDIDGEDDLVLAEALLGLRA